jgi:hypothetical protein
MGGNTVKKRCLLIIGILSVIFGTKVFAWDNVKTHPRLTERATEASKLDDYLKRVLDIPSIKETVLQHNNESKKILAWLTYGSDQEDDPMCRAANHFHNPLMQNWVAAGGTDTLVLLGLVEVYCQGSYPQTNIRSAVVWATGFTEPIRSDTQYDAGARNDNEWIWYRARQYYYTFLTGKNFSGSEIASDEKSRNEYLALCFRAIGRNMHLLQDMSVPAHVRNEGV